MFETSTKELAFVKKVQREFKERFNKELPVDFLALKGCAPRFYSPCQNLSYEEMEEMVDEIIKKHGASLERIKQGRIAATPRLMKEYKALVEICIRARTERWNLQQTGKIINKDRSAIYHHAEFYKTLPDNQYQQD